MAATERCRNGFALAIGASIFLLVASPSVARAANFKDLAIAKPVIACAQLSSADLSKAVGTEVTIRTAVETDTPKGKFCKVTGVIAPAVNFEVDLPVEHWTQRYLQNGCGGYCGNVSASIERAGSCTPALNGEFVVAADDMGHSPAAPGAGRGGLDASWGANADQRIDFAYRANHETSVAAKALIRSYYGQAQKFAYFTGCSDGGREALAEAERYPDDFDGISAGAPVMMLNIHNSFFHGWENDVNKRPDGTPILYSDRMPIVHDAVLAHCPTLSGVNEGLLEAPLSCKLDTSWFQCGAGATDTSKCLTAEESAIVMKMWQGPSDSSTGHYYAISGAPLGVETQWPGLAQRAAGRGGAGMAASSIKYLLLPDVLSDDDSARFAYNDEWFRRVNEVGAPLYNAANTNLRPFEKRGGKLLIWHGLADTSVPAAISIAYYQSVQKLLGEKTTDAFLRLFLIPGVGHCGGGDGFPQIDTLSPLMAWTEMKEAPKALMAGKVAAAGGRGAAGAPGAGRGAGGRGGQPFANPNATTTATRPVYPYPMVAHFTGKGDPNDAANYEAAKGPATLYFAPNTLAHTLIGPDNLRFFHAENGVVVADKK